MNRIGFFAVCGLVAAGLVAAAVFWPKKPGVTIYCATDEVVARPILDDFERTSGIHVRAEFDTEASKTVGLVNRLRLERQSGTPRCDVFWNNEILHTVRLAREDAFEPYASPAASDIPAQWKDAGGLWTGFAARPRILIVSSDSSMWKDDERPSSMNDFLKPKWKGRAAFAKPLAGTALTHAIVLFSVLGPDRALAWFRGLVDNGCLFPVGNGPAASAVGLRQAAFGFTDIDDFQEIERKKEPVVVVYPDQGKGEVGTLLIPNTLALVKGGPCPDLGRKLIDYLLAKDVEARLAAGDSAQVPLHPGVTRPLHVKAPPEDFRAMEVDWNDAAAHYDERFEQLLALWGR